ncbi:MAG: response regulator, partial [Spirochaetaceae bacterium]|nr:response regulator [Spirochaetaceae bacterium]
GEGTSFVLTLPAFIEHPSKEGGNSENRDKPDGIEASEGQLSANNELIMIVDDKPALVEMLSTLLKRRGYRVAGFTDPLAAYDYFAEDPSQFSLVLTDITMPALRGDRLAERIHSVRPRIPIVAYTDYSAEVNETQAAAAGITRLLHKPLETDKLADVLRNVLLKEII